MKQVYIAHAIDYTDKADHEGRWFHSLPMDGWQTWCPYCHYREGEPADVTMARNMRALALADALVAHVDTRVFSFGTPVEVWTKAVERGEPESVCLIHPARPGLFVKHLEQQGVVVVQSSVEAMRWLAQR